MGRENLFSEGKTRLAKEGRREHDIGMERKKGKKTEIRPLGEGGQKFTIEDLWKELQDVRAQLAASEERAQRLEQRVQQLEKENKDLRKKRWETEEFLQNKIKKLEKDVRDRDKKLEKANKTIAWLRKKVFGKSSEKKPERSKRAKAGDARTSDKRSRGQQAGSKGHGRTDRSGVRPGDTVRIPIPGGCKCPDCGKEYTVLKVTEDSALFDLAIDIFKTIYKQLKYVSQCSCRGKRIVTAPPPPRLYPRTDVGNSVWMYLLVQKYLNAVPTNRTLKDLKLRGFSLAEGTVTGGFKIINDLLDPLNQAIVQHCQGADLWNADETTWRVFGTGKSKWWMWLIASSDAVVYVLDPSRSKKIPQKFFQGSAGTLMTDRLSSYKGLNEEIRKAWCWVHVRRDFLNIFNGVKSQRRWAKKWLKLIAGLFVMNHRRFKYWEEGRDSGADWDAVHTDLEAHVQRIEDSWRTELKKNDLHDEQRKVLKSLKNHWQGLTRFLEDPRIPLHNNRAERLIRQAVLLRKNSYGSASEWSGQLSAKLFGLFQTWLINGLDPQAVLLDYFEECSKTPGHPPPKVDDFLPWMMSEERKAAFMLPASYSRPG